MTQAAGTASVASSTSAQNGTGVSNAEWESERARLQGELASRDSQIRALSQIKGAWERNVGKELGDVIEYDANGFPVKVNYGEPARPAYTGMNPLAASGVVDAQTAQAYDAYVQQQMSGQYVTPAQLQAQVNAAQTQSYLAATTRFETLRNVDRTVSDQRYKDLSNLDSPLAKKTEEVLTRNGWGQKSNPMLKSWDSYQFAAPNAFELAAQIAKSELFETNQAHQQSQTTAQAAQAAAGIVSPGGGAAIAPALSTDEMVKLYSQDPAKAESMARQQFEQRTGATLGR